MRREPVSQPVRPDADRKPVTVGASHDNTIARAYGNAATHSITIVSSNAESVARRHRSRTG